jgi:TolB-like protein/Tfp pilus assembly protein PilF
LCRISLFLLYTHDTIDTYAQIMIKTGIYVTEEPTRKLAVLLHADVIGSTALVQLNETVAHERIRDAFQRFSETITVHNGIAHEIRGDALVAEFSKASDAVTAALEFQTANSAHNEMLSDKIRPELRVGVAMGEVVVADNTVTGEGIVLAQRLEQLAESGGVCVQGAAYETMPKRLPFDCENLGERELKGFNEPVRVYAVTQKAVSRTDGEKIASEIDSQPTSEKDDLALPDKPSIAVLPFSNISGGQEQNYLADGITEEIITTLSRVSKLFVIARTSTLVYKDQAVDIREVGREQGVQYVLEGSVRSGSQRVRVTGQLIDATTGRHLWGQRYDRDVDDIFALQDDVTKEIVSALQVELTEGEQAHIAAQGTQNVEAWQLTFEGRDLVHEHHKDTVQKGRFLLEQAIGLDENYALAWGALAEAYWKEARNEGWSTSPERSLKLSIESSDRAIKLDPNNAGILAMRSVIMTTLRDFDGALALAERALREAHSDANAIALAAITLYVCGKAEEALKQTKLAMRHCPRYPPWYLLMLGRCHWMLGQNEEAIAASRSAIKADPLLYQPYVVLAEVYAEADQVSEARKVAENILRIEPNFSLLAYLRGLPLRDPEMEDRRRSALEKAGLPD